MGHRHDAQLACDALGAAVAAQGRRRMDGVIMHTDRGAEYTSTAFTQACRRLGARWSMSRTGSCLDNAVAESFFATLKVELVNAGGSVAAPRRGRRSSPGSLGHDMRVILGLAPMVLAVGGVG
jgi:transposase InsO family protein